jgi:hypothetical protein
VGGNELYIWNEMDIQCMYRYANDLCSHPLSLFYFNSPNLVIVLAEESKTKMSFVECLEIWLFQHLLLRT